MPTPLEILAATPRRDIRYVLISLVNGTDLVKPVHQELAPLVREHYLSQRSLDDFSVSWDIGIDDWRTADTRRDQWWCWGIKRTAIVDRPKQATTAALVEAGFGTLDASGCPLFSQADLELIMKDSDSRKGWE